MLVSPAGLRSETRDIPPTPSNDEIDAKNAKVSDVSPDASFPG
jgi:hypothetical protein